MKFNKKDLFELQSKMYDNFLEKITDDEKNEIFATGNTAKFYKIQDHKKSEIHNFNYETQINSNTLNDLGFEQNANVSKLFEVNIQTKQLVGFGDYNLM